MPSLSRFTSFRSKGHCCFFRTSSTAFRFDTVAGRITVPIFFLSSAGRSCSGDFKAGFQGMVLGKGSEANFSIAIAGSAPSGSMGPNEICMPTQAVSNFASGLAGSSTWPSTALLPQSDSGTLDITRVMRMFFRSFEIPLMVTE